MAEKEKKKTQEEKDKDLQDELEGKAALNDVWSFEDRTKRLIQGSKQSVDEVIISLYKPMRLFKMAEDKYKNAAEGRLFAVKAASEMMVEISRLELVMKHSKEGEFNMEETKDFESGLAESFAKKKK